MLHETEFAPLDAPIEALNSQVTGFEPLAILDFAVQQEIINKVALVSSFGAESIVLLHMVSLIDQNMPVLFLDTQMLFDETLAYQTGVARQLGLSDVRRIQPDPSRISEMDPHGSLHQSGKDTCCALRKTQPLQHALRGFDTWITGRKRFQSGRRADLEVFENDGGQRIKVNPLAHWDPKDLETYIKTNDLPRHPLVARGFPSIGCAPCTSAVKDGEETRSGRWRDSEKTECGIHFPNTETKHGTVKRELSTWQ